MSANTDVFILVVDDRPASGELTAAILHKGGFGRVSTCGGAVAALQILEDRPAHILISRWEMEELDGLELMRCIREIDAERNHYSYTIIYSEETSTPEIHRAYSDRLDDFINEDALARDLVLRVNVASRVSGDLNQLLLQNHNLIDQRRDLEKGQLLDPLTGLGNKEAADRSLRNHIRSIESRGGCVCLLLIGIGNYEELIQRYDERIAKEMIVGIADRLQHLVRPLDVVTYIEPGIFAIILNQPSLEQCTAECYRRIHEGIKLKSYGTAAGFMTARVGTSICASGADTGPPNPDTLLGIAKHNLTEAIRIEGITEKLLTP